MDSTTNRKSAVVKAVALVLFIVAAMVVVRFTPVRGYLTLEKLGFFLNAAGLWVPVVYVFIYAFGVCLFLPGTLLTALGAAIFGPYLGFLCTWLGAMTGASLAFYVGRYLGRDFAASLISDRLRKYDEAIAANGFATVLYLRLVYFPFTPMNFGMGLTRVRFWHYFSGTALGILVGTFIFTFFIGTVKDVWADGRWEELLSRKTTWIPVFAGMTSGIRTSIYAFIPDPWWLFEVHRQWPAASCHQGVSGSRGDFSS